MWQPQISLQDQDPLWPWVHFLYRHLYLIPGTVLEMEAGSLRLALYPA